MARHRAIVIRSVIYHVWISGMSNTPPWPERPADDRGHRMHQTDKDRSPIKICVARESKPSRRGDLIGFSRSVPDQVPQAKKISEGKLGTTTRACRQGTVRLLWPPEDDGYAAPAGINPSRSNHTSRPMQVDDTLTNTHVSAHQESEIHQARRSLVERSPGSRLPI